MLLHIRGCGISRQYSFALYNCTLVTVFNLQQYVLYRTRRNKCIMFIWQKTVNMILTINVQNLTGFR